MVKVKICGIISVSDAIAAVEAGADAIGFIFYKKSPRNIAPLKASGIISGLPKRIKKVGVFVDEKEARIKKTAALCNLDMLQFHGHESPKFCSRFRKYKVIKAFRVGNNLNPDEVRRYRVFALLFDTFVKSRAGGTGKKFDWSLLKRLGKVRQSVFLSGGLSAANVKEAIKTVRPDWVDVSSYVEYAPGKKDWRKVQDFIRRAKS